MGLDVYVGSLTRYLAGHWELITQKVGREAGLRVQVIRPRQAQAEDAIRDPEVIRPLVLSWREGLNRALADSLKEPLDWDEGPASLYFTDKPAWDNYADLMLWAAYDEQPKLKRPLHCVEDWSGDPAFRACTEENFRSRYPHLYHVALWLPCDIPFVFETEDVGGPSIVIGSSLAFLDQLQELNRRTWRAGEQQLEEWRRKNSDYGAPLESGARFALALFLHLAHRSLEHRLPMRLDW